jgi:hypothetical protein
MYGERHMSEAARRSLEELQASILFAPDFPRRISYTRAEYLIPFPDQNDLAM